MRTFLGVTRAGIVCMHSNRLPGSNDSHCEQEWRSVLHRLQRLARPTSSSTTCPHCEHFTTRRYPGRLTALCPSWDRRRAPAGARRLSQDGHKAVNLPGYRRVVKCSQCGHVVLEDVGLASRCNRCSTDLHSCSQCESFDPGSRFECMQTIPARVTPKNVRNECTLYSARTVVERETTTPRNNDARKAFDDLFNI